MITIYTDGACQGNPGPAGAGAILMYGPYKRTICKGLGISTNNVAELVAVKIALEAITDQSKKIRIFTDSKYVIGQLSQNWKINKNKELVLELRELVDRFDIQFNWVRGHSGDVHNEEADSLAVKGINLPEGEILEERNYDMLK